MDIAQEVFYVGVGAGAVLIGLALLILVFSLRRLSRDARVLAEDVRRLNRTLDQLVGDQDAESRSPASSEGEELVGWWPGRDSDRPVQSADQQQDERTA